jgi:hypothetical protein
MMTKITGINCFQGTDYSEGSNVIKFSVSFDDGITVIYHWLDEKLEYFSMLSTGLSSSFISTGKWPTKRNLEKRKLVATERVVKNRKRYKLLKI